MRIQNSLRRSHMKTKPFILIALILSIALPISCKSTDQDYRYLYNAKHQIACFQHFFFVIIYYFSRYIPYLRETLHNCQKNEQSGHYCRLHEQRVLRPELVCYPCCIKMCGKLRRKTVPSDHQKGNIQQDQYYADYVCCFSHVYPQNQKADCVICQLFNYL